MMECAKSAFQHAFFVDCVSVLRPFQKRVRLTSFNQGRAKALQALAPVLPNR